MDQVRMAKKRFENNAEGGRKVGMICKNSKLRN
jgi:hypothetical protein